MKKLLLFVACVAFSFTTNAQGFNAGITAGITTGDADVVSSFNLTVNVNYMFTTEESFNYGVASGFSNFFGKDGFDSASFLPLAAAGRYSVSEEFVLGADVGYAVGISPSGNDGGFYYRPMLGYNIGENMQLTASYSNVSVNSANWSSIGVGIMFGL